LRLRQQALQVRQLEPAGSLGREGEAALVVVTGLGGSTRETTGATERP
jgi:hypothetical protein